MMKLISLLVLLSRYSSLWVSLKRKSTKNWYEDSNAFPLGMGKEAILARIRSDIVNNVPELSKPSKVIA